MLRVLDFIIYWMIILIPFSIAISPAPMNVFMGFLAVFFIIKKILSKDCVFLKHGLNISLFLFFMITCISVFNSVVPYISLKGGVFRQLFYILIFFAVVDGLKDKKHLEHIFLSIGAGLLLTSVNSIFQVSTGKDFIRGYAPILNIGLSRATSSFKDANILGVYLSAFFPLVFGLAIFYYNSARDQKAFRCLALLLVILTGTAVCLTYSRPTLLALYVSVVLFAVIKKQKFLIGILIVFTLASPFLLPKSVKNWAKEVEYNPLRFMCNDDRIAIYINSINMIKAHPVIGVGANAFMDSYKKYKELHEYRGVGTLDEIKAHNNFFQMAGEVGLTGLTIFIWFLWGLFKQGKMVYLKLNDPYLKIYSLSLMICLAAFLINGLTESSLYYSRVAVLFWYLAGLSLSFKKLAVF